MRMFRLPGLRIGQPARAVIGCFFLLCASRAIGANTNTTEGWVAYEFQQAGARFRTQTNNAEAAWQFGRACFDIADLQKESSRKAAYAEQGIAASRVAVKLMPNSAAAHYYLGMNLGELADTKHNFSALRMVKDVEREFLAADSLNERFDEAGPDRNLGMLYRDAPTFMSIGSRTKARQHLEKAVELAPGFPDNQLSLIEAYLKWDYHNEAWRQFRELEKIWPQAQKKYSGPAWIVTWVDWNKRLASIKRKLEATTKVGGSPHSQ